MWLDVVKEFAGNLLLVGGIGFVGVVGLVIAFDSPRTRWHEETVTDEVVR